MRENVRGREEWEIARGKKKEGKCGGGKLRERKRKWRRNFCGRQSELNICCGDKVVITEGVTSLRGILGEMWGCCSYGGVWVDGGGR